MVEREYFKFYKIEEEKLIPYGFKFENGEYKYSTTIVENSFRLDVVVDMQHNIHTYVIDLFSNEEYILHLVKRAKGTYAAKVKEAYNEVLDEIKQKCMRLEIFKCQKIIQYVYEKYNDELEYPWGEGKAAVFRRKDTHKWYGLLMGISKRKLGLDSDEEVEVMNLKGNPEEVIDYIHYFPAYHMSKKNWYSVMIDETINYEELFQKINKSYELVGKS